MYAVVKLGGKQVKVEEGHLIKSEKIEGDEGSTVELNEVLLLGDANGGKSLMVGSPLVPGAKVRAKIEKQTRDAKIIVFKKKRRQNYRRKKGHRQQVTHLRIEKIQSA